MSKTTTYNTDNLYRKIQLFQYNNFPDANFDFLTQKTKEAEGGNVPFRILISFREYQILIIKTNINQPGPNPAGF